MNSNQKKQLERWEDNKERCKEVMSTTIADLTWRTDDEARDLCSEMSEKGLMDFEGVASGMKPNGTVDFENPYVKRVSDFFQENGFKRTEARQIVGAICEFAASTLLLEG